MHARIAERIVAASGVGAGDTVLEIGPGTGILTRALLKAGARVIAVEADRTLTEGLRETFAGEIAREQLILVEGDIRAFDLSTLPREYRVVANIPYYLTGELIRRLLESERQPVSMTLLVQKEVAVRIAARPRSGQARSKKESLLSLSVKVYGAPEYEFTVPRGAFVPAPKVDSAVISIRDISRAAFSSRAQEARFFALIRAGFAHKRKLLAKNLVGFVASAALSAAGVPPRARAEDIALPEWLALSKSKGLP